MTPFATGTDAETIDATDEFSRPGGDRRPTGSGREAAAADESSARCPDSPAEAPAETVVAIRSHCERCEHLSAPPRFQCTREATRIVEVVEHNRVRVRGCPVAADGESPSGLSD